MKHAEAEAQKYVFDWSKLNMRKYPQLKWLHSSQNGMVTSQASARRAVATGMKKGIADIFLPCPIGSKHGLYLEMKIKPNKPTKEQAEFLEDMRKCGYEAHVCYSANEAIDIITKYIDGELK